MWTTRKSRAKVACKLFGDCDCDVDDGANHLCHSHDETRLAISSSRASLLQAARLRSESAVAVAEAAAEAATSANCNCNRFGVLLLPLDDGNGSINRCFVSFHFVSLLRGFALNFTPTHMFFTTFSHTFSPLQWDAPHTRQPPALSAPLIIFLLARPLVSPQCLFLFFFFLNLCGRLIFLFIFRFSRCCTLLLLLLTKFTFYWLVINAIFDTLDMGISI